MFLINGVLWLVSLPFRLVMSLVALTVWTITLPLRLIWGVLSLIGVGRLFTLAVLGVAGYALWRLVSDDEVPAPVPPPLDTDSLNAAAPSPTEGNSTAS
jgi:hypothetical protein